MSCSVDIDPIYYKHNVMADIHVRRVADIGPMRHALVQHIFNAPHLPMSVPSQVKRDVSSPIVAVPDLARCEELTAGMTDGFASTMYRFIPNSNRKQAVIVHQGHQNDFGAAEMDDCNCLP